MRDVCHMCPPGHMGIFWLWQESKYNFQKHRKYESSKNIKVQFVKDFFNSSMWKITMLRLIPYLTFHVGSDLLEENLLDFPLARSSQIFFFFWKCPFFSHFYVLYLILILTFSSIAQLCPTFCDPMNRSTPGLPLHHQLPEFTQTHVHRFGDAIQPSHLL